MLGQRNPVARAQHVVRRELNACHKSHDRVFEYQHENSRHGTETSKHVGRVLVDDNAYYDYCTYAYGDNLEHLEHTFQCPVPQSLVLIGYIVQRIEYRE